MMGIDSAVSLGVSALARLFDRIIPDPVARDAAKAALLQEENRQALAAMQASLSAILAEANSVDPWTSRARPTFLYVIYTLLLACAVGAVIGIWYPREVFQAAENLNRLFKAIPQDLYNLFAVGYLGYTGARSFDKWRAQK